MPELINAAAIPQILIDNTPLLDVRAPVEFLRGALPAATNIPLLNDAERTGVGKVYRLEGQQAAIGHGHKLVSGEIRQQRIQAWRDYIAMHPGAVMYCFRGGMRSRIVQSWLATEGVQVPRVEGGYKRIRRILLDTIENISASSEFLLVAGKTGSGKTHLVNQLHNSVDLEGLANHRGSAFGTRIEGQPGQIDFENSLAIILLRLRSGNAERLFLEDESHAIGSLSIPHTLYEKMREAPIAVLEETLDQRVNTILHDYIESNYQEYKTAQPQDYERLFANYLLASLGKIRRRLGGENFQRIQTQMESALHTSADDFNAHREWIQTLLKEYYDPMYDYQLGKKSSRVVFRGNREEFLNWAAHLDKAGPGVRNTDTSADKRRV